MKQRTQARHQLKGFLLRHDLRYPGKTSWSTDNGKEVESSMVVSFHSCRSMSETTRTPAQPFSRHQRRADSVCRSRLCPLNQAMTYALAGAGSGLIGHRNSVTI